MRKSVEEIIESIKMMKGYTKDFEVADLLGVGRAALSNAKRRDSISFFDELVSFCEKEGVSLDFIRKTPISMSGSIKTIISPGNVTPEQHHEFVQVSVYLIEDADNTEIADTEPVGTVVIPKDIHKQGSLVIRVAGDSMEKLLMKGTNAVLDTNSKDIISGNIYAFKIPHEGNIVRECYSEPKGLSLRPYNKNYPSAQLGWEDFSPDMIIGKVSCSVINEFR